MKKPLLISVLALFTLSSCICAKFANVEDEGSLGYNAGDITFGGKLHYGSESQGDFKNSELKLRPYLGTLVTDKLELGVEAGLALNKSDSGSFEQKWTDLSVGPYVRYYWCDEHRLVPYVEGGVQYISNKYDDGSVEDKLTGFGAQAGLGVSYQFRDWINLMVGYTAVSYQKLGGDNVEDINSFDARLNGGRFQAGLQFKF